jgi:hypothetical protein
MRAASNIYEHPQFSSSDASMRDLQRVAAAVVVGAITVAVAGYTYLN